MPATDSTQLQPIDYADGVLRYIDQTRLPSELRIVETRDWRDIERAIRRLDVRGAPLIGIAAAYGIALAARAGELDRAAAALVATRPTAVNLRWAIDRTLRSGSDAASIEREARLIHEEERAGDAAIARHGAALIEPGSTVLTHCNTGALATGGAGTALGVIKEAHAQGRVACVLVDETRPLLQGARLTAWELSRASIRYDIIVDGAAASLIARGMVQAVIVGADRIAANGDTANKIGTYGLALAAHAHDVPFYVAAPISTIDHATATGDGITIEERSADEVLALAGTNAAPSGSSALNPAFDVTPAHLIAAIVTEAGVLHRPYEASIGALTRQPAVMR